MISIQIQYDELQKQSTVPSLEATTDPELLMTF